MILYTSLTPSMLSHLWKPKMQILKWITFENSVFNFVLCITIWSLDSKFLGTVKKCFEWASRHSIKSIYCICLVSIWWRQYCTMSTANNLLSLLVFMMTQRKLLFGRIWMNEWMKCFIFGLECAQRKCLNTNVTLMFIQA